MGKQVQLGISRRKGGYVLHNPQGNVMTHNNEHRGIPPPSSTPKLVFFHSKIVLLRRRYCSKVKRVTSNF